MNNLQKIPENTLSDVLPTQVKNYVRASVSDRSRKEYQTDLKRFLQHGGTIPSSSEEVAAYLSDHGESHKASTLERWKVSIGKAHTTQQYPDPTKSELVRTVLKGIRRTHGASQRRVEPTLKEDILAMVSTLGDRLKDKRDKALILIGFAGAFRRSELVALATDNIKETREGLVITFKKSKSDQEQEGQKVGIPFARGRHCPVKAYKEWLEVSKIQEGAVFRSINRHSQIGKRLSADAVAVLIKSHAERIGLNPKEYSGHSLRAGLATAAAKEGIPIYKICNQTRHKSSRMLDRYIRDGQIFTDNAAGIL